MIALGAKCTTYQMMPASRRCRVSRVFISDNADASCWTSPGPATLPTRQITASWSPADCFVESKTNTHGWGAFAAVFFCRPPSHTVRPGTPCPSGTHRICSFFSGCVWLIQISKTLAKILALMRRNLWTLFLLLACCLFTPKKLQVFFSNVCVSDGMHQKREVEVLHRGARIRFF